MGTYAHRLVKKVEKGPSARIPANGIVISMKRSIKDYLLIALKGVGMGSADVVPGVSGGTIAFITGIYEELLTSIKSFNLDAFKALKNGGIKGFWTPY